MGKNKKNNKEKFLIAIVLLLLLLFGYFLYDDSLFYKFQSKVLQKEVGILKTQSEDVRRKLMDEFEWGPIKDFAKLYWGDSVFTGDQANAIIQLHEGSQIDMDPQTLVVLNMRNDGFELDMEFGKMKLQLASDNILMKIDKEELSIKNANGPGAGKSKVLITKVKSKNPELIVLDGKVKVQKVEIPRFGSTPIIKSKPIEVKSSEKVELNSKINTAVPKVVNEFSSLAPTSGSLWVQSESKKIKLEWVYSGEKDHFDVEVSNQKDFGVLKPVASQQKIQVNFHEFAYEKDEELHWKVSAKDKTGKLILESQTNSILVFENVAPKILEPKNDFVLIIPRDKTGALLATPPLKLLLEEKYKSSKILVQLAKNKEFNPITKEFEIADTTNPEIKDLTVGQYFLRVRTEGPNHPLTGFSDAVSFSVEEDLLEKIGTPVLKNIDSPFTLKEEKNKLIWPQVKWDKTENAATYDFEVSTDSNFKAIVKTGNISDSKFTIEKILNDKYFVRVRGVSKTKYKGFWSESKSFELQIPAPVLMPIKDLVGETKQWNAPPPLTPVPLKWSIVPTAKLYLVEIAKDEKFTQVVSKQQIVDNKFQWKVSESNTYYVRVTGHESSKRAITKPSNVEKFKYTFRRPLMKPQLLEPKEKFSFILYEMDIPNIVLKWSLDPKSYLSYVEISYDKNFKKIKHASTSTTNTLILDKNLIRGKVYWRVRTESKDKEAQSDWADPGIFSVVGLEDMEQ